ncbi:MAG: hypothetical protein IJ300_08740, partial [Clostridia bacterium]|nr:hypothetical protein [Clostridia bacterium]
KKTPDMERIERTNKSLKSDKLFLETKIHKMQVDMEHMKKDIIRDVLSELINPAYGYPLSELYLCSKDDQLPENVRGIIQNLFATLSNAGIKLLKTTELGENLIFNEEISEKYEIYRYHEIKMGDGVYVCYPGYRYERETIIKPTVKRKDA